MILAPTPRLVDWPKLPRLDPPLFRECGLENRLVWGRDRRGVGLSRGRGRWGLWDRHTLSATGLMENGRAGDRLGSGAMMAGQRRRKPHSVRCSALPLRRMHRPDGRLIRFTRHTHLNFRRDTGVVSGAEFHARADRDRRDRVHAVFLRLGSDAFFSLKHHCGAGFRRAPSGGSPCLDETHVGDRNLGGYPDRRCRSAGHAKSAAFVPHLVGRRCFCVSRNMRCEPCTLRRQAICVSDSAICVDRFARARPTTFCARTLRFGATGRQAQRRALFRPRVGGGLPRGHDITVLRCPRAAGFD